jgi:protein TonB
MRIKIQTAILFASLLAVVACLNLNEAQAQSSNGAATTTQSDPEKIYEAGECSEMPSYPGGEVTMTKFLQKTLKYPSEAIRAEKQGKVFVEFVVEKNGEITNLKVLHGLGYGLDEETMRTIRLMPKWLPGRVKGVSVRLKMVVPVSYSITNSK